MDNQEPGAMPTIAGEEPRIPWDPDWWFEVLHGSDVLNWLSERTEAVLLTLVDRGEVKSTQEELYAAARSAVRNYFSDSSSQQDVACYLALHVHDQTIYAAVKQADAEGVDFGALSSQERTERRDAQWTTGFLQSAFEQAIREYVLELARVLVEPVVRGESIPSTVRPYDYIIDRYIRQREKHKPPTRRSNRKIQTPTFPNGLLPIPNILNHGTRHLGQMLAGAAEWTNDPDRHAMVATINGRTVGMIEFGIGGEDEAGRIIDALGPRSLKEMVALSALIWQKTRGPLVNHGVTLGIGEVTRAMGYKPGKAHNIDTDIALRVAADLRGLTRIMTYAADTPWDKKSQRAGSGWIAPLLIISAIHVEQMGLDGTTVPIEFDAMLGRNWAEAMQERYDVLQVAPGFMELNPRLEGQAINLAWFYLTDFRYRMKRGARKYPMRIPDLCAAARLDTGAPKDRGRFLTRLEQWHARIQDLGIIGSYERDPKIGANWPPSKVFAEGTYRVTEPTTIIDAYKKKVLS